jgi:adenine-specific DNA methylase
MIHPSCHRLAEVDFPIAAVSRHSAREKSIRHGHPNTLYLWWARLPLAACRAVLLALLLSDSAELKTKTMQDSTRFDWHEMLKVQYYWLGVDAM